MSEIDLLTAISYSTYDTKMAIYFLCGLIIGITATIALLKGIGKW
jgi:hypothetical protein